jgi:hypothetical protein
VERTAIDIGKNRNRLDAQLTGGTQHPQGDLTTVGDEQALEEGAWHGTWAEASEYSG